jgi:hypothetical protein
VCKRESECEKKELSRILECRTDEHLTKELLGTSRSKNRAEVKYAGIRETIERRTDH